VQLLDRRSRRRVHRGGLGDGSFSTSDGTPVKRETKRINVADVDGVSVRQDLNIT